MPHLGLSAAAPPLASSNPVLLTSGVCVPVCLLLWTILLSLCCCLRWVLIEFARVSDAVHRGHSVLVSTRIVSTATSFSCGALVMVFALMMPVGAGLSAPQRGHWGWFPPLPSSGWGDALLIRLPKSRQLTHTHACMHAQTHTDTHTHTHRHTPRWC